MDLLGGQILSLGEGKLPRSNGIDGIAGLRKALFHFLSLKMRLFKCAGNL
jgi:hypothetical protein